MYSFLKYLKNISTVLIFSCLVFLQGCPEYDYHKVFNASGIKMLKAKKGIYDMQFLCSGDALAEVIKGIGIGIKNEYRVYFNKDDAGGIKKALENNRLLLGDDIFIMGRAYRENTPVWEHIFIVRKIDSNKCGFFLIRPIRPHSSYRPIESYRNTVYFFDWESAIAQECVRRGIKVLEK